jgi:MFS family permease
VGATAVNFFSTLTTTFVVIYVSNQLHGDSTAYGIFLALMSAGAAVGALLVGRLNAVRYAGKAMASSFLIFSVASTLLAVERNVALAYSMAVLLGSSLSWANTVFYSALQLTVPNRVLGRVFSVDEVMSYACVPAAQIAGGLIIQFAGVSVDYALAGLGLLVSTLLLLGVREFRQFACTPRSKEGSFQNGGVVSEGQ